MIKIFKKLFDTEYKELKRFNEIATKIDAFPDREEYIENYMFIVYNISH